MKNKKILKVINDNSNVDLAMSYALSSYETTVVLPNECPETRAQIAELVNRGISNYQRILRNRIVAKIEYKYLPWGEDEIVPF